MFSVLIPTRNRPHLLIRALTSVLSQQGAPLQIIVADDGDGRGAAAADALGDARIETLLTSRAGQVPARNRMLKQATGTTIAFLDDDDWWEDPSHLTRAAERLGAQDALTYAQGIVILEPGSGGTGRQLPFSTKADAASIRRDNTVLTSGIVYPRHLHQSLGPFDEGLPHYWDWDWLLRVTAAGHPLLASGSTGVRYTMREDNDSGAANEAARRADLSRLCAKHGLGAISLKNHLAIAEGGAGA